MAYRPKALVPNELAWIDTETSGFKYADGARVVEVACEITTPDLEVKEVFEAKIRLPPGALRDLGFNKGRSGKCAFDINGYDDGPGGEWEHAPLLGSPAEREIWAMLHRMTRGRFFYAQNHPFDVPMVEGSMRAHGLEPLWDERRQGETMMFTMQVMHRLACPNASLEDTYNWLGGPPLPKHRARADIKRAQFMYKTFYLDTNLRDVLQGMRERALAGEHNGAAPDLGAPPAVVVATGATTTVLPMTPTPPSAG